MRAPLVTAPRMPRRVYDRLSRDPNMPRSEYSRIATRKRANLGIVAGATFGILALFIPAVLPYLTGGN